MVSKKSKEKPKTPRQVYVSLPPEQRESYYHSLSATEKEEFGKINYIMVLRPSELLLMERLRKHNKQTREAFLIKLLNFYLAHPKTSDKKGHSKKEHISETVNPGKTVDAAINAENSRHHLKDIITASINQQVGVNGDESETARADLKDYWRVSFCGKCQVSNYKLVCFTADSALLRCEQCGGLLELPHHPSESKKTAPQITKGIL